MTGALFAGLDAVVLGYAVAMVFVAAVVRGYSGFGSSAVMVTSLTLVLPPVEVVPVAMLLEVAASLGLLAQAWRHVAWRATAWLLAGAALGMPVGLALLAEVSAEVMRAVISLLVLAASLALWFGWRARGEPRPYHVVGTGIASGLANGVAAVGGLPVVLFLLSTAAGMAMSRATLIVYLMLGDIYGLAVAHGHGLVTREALLRAGLLTAPLFLGLALGTRRFLRSEPESFRRFALLLLMVLAGLGLLRAILG